MLITKVISFTRGVLSKMSEEVIELGNDIQVEALDAFYSNNYFEAVQLMQLHLELSVRSLLFSSGPKRNNSDFLHANNVSQEISLIQGIKCLYVFGKISKEQYITTSQFNRMRNKMVHQFNSAKLSAEPITIKKVEFEAMFIRANDLSNEFFMQAMGKTKS